SRRYYGLLERPGVKVRPDQVGGLIDLGAHQKRSRSQMIRFIKLKFNQTQ
ncbi:hypothetical protein LINPERHAP1_LOCUS35806, partial [Linum perenne]